MMQDPASGKYYCYCTDGPAGDGEGIGIPVRSSDDLVTFVYRGRALSRRAAAQGRDNGPRYGATRSFWAPFGEFYGGEFRLYYAATRAFGSSESRIWLAVSDDPLGPFENRGVVADSWGARGGGPNAIDPHVVHDGERAYLVYGSFFGGIYLKELDPATGLALDKNPKAPGVCLSRRPPSAGPDGPEGAAVCREPDGGYFYLFQSYGWLGDTYDIRVGRARRVEGPYLDRRGRNLAGESRGEKLAGSYRFEAARPPHGDLEPGWAWDGLRAPGHGVPFYDEKRRAWFFVHHLRDGAAVNRRLDRDGRASYRRFYMVVRPMFFRNGWPLLSPEPFGGESLLPLEPRAGTWEVLRFEDGFNGLARSARETLGADDPLFRDGTVYEAPDLENGGTCLCLTSADGNGNAVWGKRKEDAP